MNEDETLENSNEEQDKTVENIDTRDIIEQAFEKHESTQEQAKDVEQKTQQSDVDIERNPYRSWKKEAQQELAKLPETTQKFIQEREEQFHKGIEQYKEAANFAKSIDNSIKPYKEYLQQLNVTPDVAFSNLLKTEKTLRTGSINEKVEMFQKLAHDYGINLEALASVPFDPQLAHYKAQLEWTQSQLQASENFKQSQEDVQIYSVLDQFGQQHEHFEDVRLTMADLLDKGLADNLDDAYAKAVRLNDDVFTKVQAKNANQAAKAAKAAAVSVKGSPIGVKTQALPKTTEDAVRWAMAQHGL